MRFSLSPAAADEPAAPLTMAAIPAQPGAEPDVAALGAPGGPATRSPQAHGGARDRRPLLTHLRDPALGLHVLDVNIALGNLVQLVRDEAAPYRHS